MQPRSGPGVALDGNAGTNRTTKGSDSNLSQPEEKMTTRITRVEDEKKNRMVLKLEGTLTAADAKLLEEICSDVTEELGYGITIDLAGVDFVGRSGAEILSRLKKTPDLTFEGMHLFVEQIMESIDGMMGNGKEGDRE
jgi:anti-anti-sigma regulatory factor